MSSYNEKKMILDKTYEWFGFEFTWMEPNWSSSRFLSQSTRLNTVSFKVFKINFIYSFLGGKLE